MKTINIYKIEEQQVEIASLNHFFANKEKIIIAIPIMS